MKVLIGGFAGVGKTRISLEFAQRLKVQQYDLDEEISLGEGKEVKEIIRVDGIDCFRQLEVTYLNKISAQKNCVVSLGGGTLETEACRKIAAGYDKSFWICNHPSTIISRLTGEELANRPLLADQEDTPEKAVSEMLLSRFDNYMTLQTRVWAGQASISQLVDALEDLCKDQTRSAVIGPLGKCLKLGTERNERVDAVTLLNAIQQTQADQYLIQEFGGLSAELVAATYHTNQQLLNVFFGLYCITEYFDWERAFQRGLEIQENNETWIPEQLLSASMQNGETPYLVGPNLQVLDESSAKQTVFNALACCLKAVRDGQSELTKEYVTDTFMKLVELTELAETDFYTVEDENFTVTSSGSKAMSNELSYRYLKRPGHSELFVR